MANFDDTGRFGPQRGPAEAEPAGLSFGQVTSIAGALASLALVVGVGVWGYRLVMRDVSGVPVVRALEGPMRILPEDPGGEAVDYQGLAVNRIVAEGTAAPPPERLVLAPRPVELTPEDVAVEVAVAADGAGRLSDGEVAAPVGDLTGSQAPEAAGPGGAGAVENAAKVEKVTPVAMRAQQPSAVAAVSEGAPPPASAAASAPMSAPPVSPAVLDAPGVRVSPRPPARPHQAVARVAEAPSRAAAIAAALREATSPEIAPDELLPGSALAQLGAFETAELARSAWERISARFGDYMEGRRRVVQKARSGGRVFYRLRVAGFDDLGDARRFCAALEAENAECVPVVLR